MNSSRLTHTQRRTGGSFSCWFDPLPVQAPPHRRQGAPGPACPDSRMRSFTGCLLILIAACTGFSLRGGPHVVLQHGPYTTYSRSSVVMCVGRRCATSWGVLPREWGACESPASSLACGRAVGCTFGGGVFRPSCGWVPFQGRARLRVPPVRLGLPFRSACGVVAAPRRSSFCVPVLSVWGVLVGPVFCASQLNSPCDVMGFARDFTYACHHLTSHETITGMKS